MEFFGYAMIIVWFLFTMVLGTHGGGSGSRSSSGSGSGFGDEPINESTREFVTSKIDRGSLDVTLGMFGTIKEGIMELLDEWLGAFHAEIAVGQIGA